MKRVFAVMTTIALLGITMGAYADKAVVQKVSDAAKFTNVPGDTRTEYDSRYTVKAYKLTPAQESLFKTNDSIATPFWSQYETNDLEMVTLTTTQNGGWNYVPWTGENDAKLIAKFAYGQSGLYLYIEVQDNNWADLTTIGKPGIGSWAIDAADFLLDYAYGKGAREIYQNPTDHFIGPNKNELTLTGAQYQCRFGGLEPVTTFRLLRYDQRVVSPLPTYVQPTGIPEVGIEFSKAAIDYGIHIENIKFPQATMRAQEWLIPWDQIGQIGGTGGDMPAVGQKIAMTIGYNDMDGNDTMYNSLRWRNDGDPYRRVWVDLNHDGKQSSDEYLPVHAWGDIYIGNDFPAVIHPYKSEMLKTKIIRTEYYTLTGKRINASAVNGFSSVTSKNLVIRRSIGANGKTFADQVLPH